MEKIVFEVKMIDDEGRVLDDVNAIFELGEFERHMWTTLGLELCNRHMMAEKQCYGTERDAHKINMKMHNLLVKAMKRYKED